MLEEGILRSEYYLSESYLPERLPHREKEIEEIVLIIKPFIYGRSANNLVISGPPGTGKTSCVRHILNQVSENTDVNTAYINCWNYNTRASLYAKILQEQGIAIPRQGRPLDAYYEMLLEFIKKQGRLLIALDEFDQLHEKSQAIYDLVGINQFYENSLALIIISYKREGVKDLSHRAISRLNPKLLEFKPYSKVEILDILRERVELAFRPNSVQEEALEVIAEKAMEHNGDARIAIELLLEAGRQADLKGCNLTPEVVKSLFMRNSQFPLD